MTATTPPTPPGPRPRLRALALAGLALLGQDTPLPSEKPMIRLDGGDASTASTVRDLTGEGFAFLEIEVQPVTAYVEQRVRLTIRVGLAVDFADQHLVQLFARPLDLPVQLDVAELEALPGTRPLATNPRPGSTVSLAVDETITSVPAPEEILRDGTRFRVVTLERAFRPTASGTVHVPECHLRLAYASRFTDDVFHGRVAADRIDARVRSRPLELAVLDWPESGRPADFTGAVGDFALRASADPRDLVLGESLRVSLTFEGSGNLDRFEAPRLEWRGFDLLGRLDEPGEGRRMIAYDLVPTSREVMEVPEVAFVTLDPGPPATYRTLRTPSIPILVRPPERGTAPREPDGGNSESSANPARWIVALAVALGLAWALARRRKA